MTMPPYAHDNPEIRWLLDLTSIPTAAGREHAVVAWIERWVAERPDLTLQKDPVGNLVVARRAARAGEPPVAHRPLYITAHLDHPAFVVERVIGPGTLLATFRGGVMDAYFKDAAVRVVSCGRSDSSNRRVAAATRESAARVTEKAKKEPFPECLLELDGDGSPAEVFMPGDVAVWDLPPARIEGDRLLAPACDDLAAVASALAVMDRLRAKPGAAYVRLLFTRAEEVGFIGAIAACKLGTMPEGARVIALENSRSFAESPIGGGPIVRVGDRLSVFHPGLTSAIGKVAEQLGASSNAPPLHARDESSSPVCPPFRWQRKLMAGGACEASAYQSYGYESTCVCLPLGNYHNMADLERVQANDADAVAAARVGPEIISVSDYLSMNALLEACALGLDDGDSITAKMDRLYAEKGFVLR